MLARKRRKRDALEQRPSIPHSDVSQLVATPAFARKLAQIAGGVIRCRKSRPNNSP
jgi:hypothetical protein